MKLDTPDKHIADNQPIRQQLATYYELVQVTILSRQDPITGLLFQDSAIDTQGHRKPTWLYDNLYSILVVWSLTLAYRRQGNEESKRYCLEQSTVKLMRGLLAAIMEQVTPREHASHSEEIFAILQIGSDTRGRKLEAANFAQNQLPPDALALFLLILVQMTASGLFIIFTLDEVDFIQNLTYCLAHPCYPAYLSSAPNRCWCPEELDIASLSLIKAALEMLQGFNLFGLYGNSASSIHVLADDIAKTRNILNARLSRAADIDEIAAPLLSVVSFPAFAVDDLAWIAHIRQKSDEQLCRQIARERLQSMAQPAQSAPADQWLTISAGLRRLGPAELQLSLGLIYLMLDSAISADLEQTQHYQRHLAVLLNQHAVQQLLPNQNNTAADLLGFQKKPAVKHHYPPGTNTTLRAAQSLYLISTLLQNNLIHPADLDPLNRRRGDRRADGIIHLAIIAEDATVKTNLETHGIITQTWEQIRPLKVRPAAQLETVFQKLGRNPALGLTGCPCGRLGSLVTCQVFTFKGGETTLFLPPFLNQTDSYLSLDNRLLIARLKAELAYIKTHWNQPGHPLMTLLITNAMLKTGGHQALLELLQQLQTDGFGDNKVRVGKLVELLPSAAWERLDTYEPPPENPLPLFYAGETIALVWRKTETRPLALATALRWQQEADNRRLLAQLNNSRNPYEQIELLRLLWKRLEPNFLTASGHTLRQFTEAVYVRAGDARLWAVLRGAAGMLEKVDEGLEKAVTKLLASQHPVAIGLAYSSQAVITHPLSHTAFRDLLRAYGSVDPRGQALLQELIVFLGLLNETEPHLFNQLTTLHPWHFLLLMTGYLAKEWRITRGEAFEALLKLSPSAILSRLHQVIAHRENIDHVLTHLEALRYEGQLPPLRQTNASSEADLGLVGDDIWSTWREISGTLTTMPEDVGQRVLDILAHCQGLIIGNQLDARNRLDSIAMLANPTANGMSCEQRITQLLREIPAPAYRQLNIETLLVLSDVFKRHPELRVHDYLVLDVVIGTAVYLAWRETYPASTYSDYSESCAEAWNTFCASPPHQVNKAILAALAFLMTAAEQERKADSEKR